MAQGYLILTTLKTNELEPRETWSDVFLSRNDALQYELRTRLNGTVRHPIYRRELVENFGDRTRYALFDNRWQDPSPS
jgi:hypothetical protein